MKELMKLSLANSYLLKGLVANLIGKIIRKKINTNLTVFLDDITITEENGRIKAHLDINLLMNTKDFVELIRRMMADDETAR